MSERPFSGRSPRGASRGSGDPPEAHPQTDANPVGDDDASLEVSPRPRSRKLRVVERPSTKDSEEDVQVANATRIMSLDDVEAPEEDAGDDVEATQAGPPISIEVVEGPDAGKKKRVRGGRMIIGRGDGCDLKLRDTSASRRHLEIIVGASGCIARDLGSGNGTKVNGERIDEVSVSHGDEVVVGTTLLRIVDELAALEERRKPKARIKEPEPPPHVEPFDGEPEDEADDGAGVPARRAPSASRRPGRASGTAAVSIPEGEARPKKNLIILGGVAGGALLLLGILIALLRPASPPPVPAGPTKDDVRSAKLMQDGKAALAAADYDKADGLWDEIEKIDPNNVDLPDLRVRTKKEREARKAYQGAVGQIAEHNFDAARDALKSISPDTLVSDQANDLLKSLDKKQAEFLAQQVEAKLAAKDIEGARTLLPDLGRIAPADFDRVSKEIDDAQAEADRDALKNIKSRKKREAMMREMKARKANAAVQKDLDSGFRKFHEASTPPQFDRAASEFDRISEGARSDKVRSRAHELAKSVRALSRYLADANQLDADQSYAAEITPLSGALQALEKIEPSGGLMGKLKNRMVRGLVIKGRDAAARQDYAVAAKAFAKALQLKPGESSAREGMNNLRSRAKDVYLQAYEEQDRDPDSAKKLYEAVVQMTPSDDEYHDKAQKRLKALQGRDE